MQKEPQVPNFMQYPANTQHLQKQYLQLKTLPELQAVQRKQIEQEYMVQLLRGVDYDNAEFYTKQSRMNRYCDIFAYEHSRVKVPQIDDFYVNANEVRSLVDGKVFATFAQAPVPKFDNFWEAIYYKDISLVIMLCSFFDPKRGHQAQQYWPNQSQTVSFSKPSLKVTNALKKQIDTDFVETTFHIDGPDGVKVLRHLHWTGWSDLKKPAEGNMKPFEFLIEECIKLISEEKNIIIHCSAGIGRTGTLGGIIEAIRLYEKNKKISIYQIVENMRKYRYYAVQTFEQYNFMYDYLRKILK